MKPRINDNDSIPQCAGPEKENFSKKCGNSLKQIQEIDRYN